MTPLALATGTVDGKLYEIPESLTTAELLYSGARLTAAPVTTADWLASAKKLGWVYGINGGGAYYLWGLWGAFGATVMDPTTGKCTADQDGSAAAALAWLISMKAAGLHFYQDAAAARTDFISGKIAGYIDGSWQLTDLAPLLGARLAVAAGPASPDGTWSPLTTSAGFYINAASSHGDLAAQFALQMLAPANEQLFANVGHLPANSTVVPTNPLAQAWSALLSSGSARPALAQMDNYWPAFGNALQAVIDSGTDPTRAVADACAAMDKANEIP
jgi:maltose-binding protein MalE